MHDVPTDWVLPGTRFGVQLEGAQPEALIVHLRNLRLTPQSCTGRYPRVAVRQLGPQDRHSAPQPTVQSSQGTTTLHVTDGTVTIKAGEPCSRLALSCGAQLDEPIAPGISLFRAFALQGAIWMHALAFEHADRSILALGPSGSGKSTLAAAVIAAGGRLVSDDSVLLHEADNLGFQALCLRNFIRLRRPSEQLLPEYLHRLLIPSERSDSWVLDMEDLSSQRRLSTTVDTLWLLSDTDQRPAHSGVRQAAQGEALAQCIDATIPCFYDSAWPDVRQQLLGMLTQLLARSDLYAVTIGRDLMTRPQATLAGVIDAMHKRHPSAGDQD